VLRRIFGPKTDEVKEGWRKSHNKKEDNVSGTYNTLSEMTIACNILGWKLEGKVPFRRPRCRWKNNIKMHIRGVECWVWTGFV